MRRINIIFLLVVFIISGCSSEHHIVKKPVPPPIESYLKSEPIPFHIAPIKKKISILDLEKVSLYAKSISYKDAIVQILRPKSLNVAFDNNLDNYVTNPLIDLSLDNVSLRNALNTIAGITGISWEKRKNTIWITPFKTKIYDVGFLGIVRSSKSTLGGDVLGGSSGSTDNNVTTPLQGSFTLNSSSNAKKGDIYKILSDNIKNLLSKNGHFTLDQASGILMVTDKPENIRLITQYMNAISKSYRRQVMIEVKIVEIDLSKNWKLGINWNVLSKNTKLGQVINVGQHTIDFGTSNPALKLDVSKIFHTENTEITLNSVINALSQFGSLRLVSEPHLRVMNAQPAILSVGRSISFVKSVEITQSATGESTVTTPDVSISSIFDGIVFGITPFIKNNGKVLLRIVPIKSKLISLEEKKISGNTYTLPTVDLREASTVVDVESGNIIALGGLISKTKQNKNTGLPFLSNLPVIGNAFKQQNHLSNNIELVILLKPVILR